MEFHSKWVAIGKKRGMDQQHLMMKAEPDARFVFEFDGVTECNLQRAVGKGLRLRRAGHAIWELGFRFAALLPLAISLRSSSREDIQRCPFLRNIHQPTSFSFSAVNFSTPVRGHGPIFEDGPNFDNAFSLFHGHNGVVPLSGRTFVPDQKLEPEISPEFNPLAAKAATISLSAFGPGGPFGFDFFSNKWKKQNGRSSNSQKRGDSAHESRSNEWLETGQCPIAKSYRAVSAVLPLVANVLKPPPSMKLRCPPVVVAARAALARTSFVKNLRPQPLPAKMLAIALLGMAANVPLGVWREHTEKFSPQWVMAVHAAVPFVAMLRKSVLMPKAAMAITIAASILGQTIGSRAERIRLKAVAASAADEGNPAILKTRTLISATKTGQCSHEVSWDPLSLKPRNTSNPPAPSICY
ncbi:uncharacterized protein LOC121990805 [Zingiber officinale]|uniref:uncharacterized protein LOC121990805 n=1 Tax=Zingiber officinale TaxID=94328 RepID=UPI001C4B37B6|nr:uncharacterized protein LOC121990805 [Zingiber officinale]